MNRLSIGIVALLLAPAPLAAQPAQPQQPAAPTPAPATPAPAPGSEQWLIGDTRIASVPARIVFPRNAGVLDAYNPMEFSHEGEGIDNAIQYRSADRAIIGTVYIYYPGLPHSGLSAFATEEVMRQMSQTPLTGGEMRIVAAGGVEGVAIRADYAGFMEGMASSAAFIKTGRWIIKLRVSGPEARRAEVDAAMAALLAGITFGRANPPRRATVLTDRKSTRLNSSHVD